MISYGPPKTFWSLQQSAKIQHQMARLECNSIALKHICFLKPLSFYKKHIKKLTYFKMRNNFQTLLIYLHLYTFKLYRALFTRGKGQLHGTTQHS